MGLEEGETLKTLGVLTACIGRRSSLAKHSNRRGHYESSPKLPTLGYSHSHPPSPLLSPPYRLHLKIQFFPPHQDSKLSNIMTLSQEIIKVKGLKKQNAYLAGIQVGSMFHRSRVISIVSLLYHRIKQLSKYLMERERVVKDRESLPRP